MDEWRLYGPLLAHWQSQGYHAAASVTDPRGRRIEVDVVAFTPDLDDVVVTEAKVRATGALVRQGVDRLSYAPRVYAAVPAPEAARLLGLASDGDALALGVLAVHPGGEVTTAREAVPVTARLAGGPQRQLERALRGLLAEGRARSPAR